MIIEWREIERGDPLFMAWCRVGGIDPATVLRLRVSSAGKADVTFVQELEEALEHAVLAEGTRV